MEDIACGVIGDFGPLDHGYSVIDPSKEGMDHVTDAYNERLCFSLEELEGENETRFVVGGEVATSSVNYEFYEIDPDTGLQISVEELVGFRDDGGFQSPREMFETQAEFSTKRKHGSEDAVCLKKKEIICDSWDSLEDESLVTSSSCEKRKGLNDLADDSGTTTALSVPSFESNERIGRVVNRFGSSPSTLKSNRKKPEGSSDWIWDGFDVATRNSTSDPLVSQLHSVVQDPLEEFSSTVTSSFSDYKNGITIDQPDLFIPKRKKVSNARTLEIMDIMKDTYWTDCVIQNGTKEPEQQQQEASHKIRKHQNLDQASNKQKPTIHVNEKAPVELVMHFPMADSVPSEPSLNKMFRRFGPLKESETEVDRQTNRARVVFKSSSDAETAYGSAPKFNIFGSVPVTYQLNDTITVPFKTAPAVASHGKEDAAVLLHLQRS